MTSHAPQPAPLRPGQRAAKPAKALSPQQREYLEFLAKPGAKVTYGNADKRTILSLVRRGLAAWPKQHISKPFRITPAGRAALRAGSREGGRGRRR
jgi:hypothetical protein